MIKLDRKIINFRYKKKFILNIIKLNKSPFSSGQLNLACHEFCPICLNKEAFLISEVDRIGVPCDTVICKKCGFVFNNSFIKNPQDFYQNQWATERWGDPENSFLKRTSKDAFTWRRFEFLKEKLLANYNQINNVLEIGCGDGCNLLPYYLEGKKVLGCDFDSRFLEPGRRRGLNLIQGDIDSINQNNFNLIMLIHSFEHVINMEDMITSVSKKLSPGGLIFIEVPGIIGWNQTRKNFSTDMGLQSSNNFMGYIQFQHNYHFNLETLKNIWEINGFEMIYGDEWVRAIFRKNSYEANKTQVSFDGNHSYNIIKHLNKVESDYMSLNNLLSGFLRVLSRKFFGEN